MYSVEAVMAVLVVSGRVNRSTLWHAHPMRARCHLQAVMLAACCEGGLGSSRGAVTAVVMSGSDDCNTLPARPMRTQEHMNMHLQAVLHILSCWLINNKLSREPRVVKGAVAAVAVTGCVSCGGVTYKLRALQL